MTGSIPVEENRGKTTMEDIMESLPDLMKATSIMVTSYILSGYAENEIYLTSEVKENFFTSKEVLEVQSQFRAMMMEIDAIIVGRNNSLLESGGIPYDVLRPTIVPCGVAI